MFFCADAVTAPARQQPPSEPVPHGEGPSLRRSWPHAPCRPPLAGFQELLRPAVIKPLGDTFPPAQLRNTGLATQAIQDDADLLLGRIVLAGRPPDVLHQPL